VSAADTNRPDTVQPSGHRPQFPEAAVDSHGVRSVQCRSPPWTPAAVSGCPAGCIRTAAAGPPPFRRDGRASHVGLARLRWSRGPGRRGQPVAAVRTRGHRTRPAGHREPAPSRDCGHLRPPQGHADTAAAVTLDSRQQRRPPSQPVSDRNETARCGTGRHDRPTARSVAWCSASIWSAPDGSTLLTPPSDSASGSPRDPAPAPQASPWLSSSSSPHKPAGARSTHPTWSPWSAPARGSRTASSSNDPTNQEAISKPRDQGGHETGRHVGQRELPSGSAA
jgi:hypothetical protein